MPAGLADGDHVFVWISTRGGNDENSSPPEFDRLGSELTTGNLYHRACDGTEAASYEWNYSGGWTYSVVAIMNGASGTPVIATLDEPSPAGSASSFDAASVAGAAVDDLLLVFAGGDDDTPTMSLPAGSPMTEVVEHDANNRSPQIIASEVITTAGATGTRTIDMASANTHTRNAFTVLVPAVAAAPITEWVVQGATGGVEASPNATCDGTNDEVEILAGAAEAHTRGIPLVLDGNFTLDADLDLTEAHLGTWDLTNATLTINHAGANPITVDAQTAARVDVGGFATTALGATSITLDTDPAGAIAVGDWLLLHDHTNVMSRSYYHPGDYVKVTAVSGTTITFTGYPTLFAYDAADDLHCYRIRPSDDNLIILAGTIVTAQTSRSTPVRIRAVEDLTWTGMTLTGPSGHQIRNGIELIECFTVSFSGNGSGCADTTVSSGVEGSFVRTFGGRHLTMIVDSTDCGHTVDVSALATTSSATGNSFGPTTDCNATVDGTDSYKAIARAHYAMNCTFPATTGTRCGGYVQCESGSFTIGNITADGLDRPAHAGTGGAISVDCILLLGNPDIVTDGGDKTRALVDVTCAGTITGDTRDDGTTQNAFESKGIIVGEVDITGLVLSPTWDVLGITDHHIAVSSDVIDGFDTSAGTWSFDCDDSFSARAVVEIKGGAADDTRTGIVLGPFTVIGARGPVVDLDGAQPWANRGDITIADITESGTGSGRSAAVLEFNQFGRVSLRNITPQSGMNWAGDSFAHDPQDSDFTVVAWATPTADTSETFAHKGADASSGQRWSIRQLSSNQLSCQVSDGTTQALSPGSYASPAAGVEAKVGFVWDSSAETINGYHEGAGALSADGSGTGMGTIAGSEDIVVADSVTRLDLFYGEALTYVELEALGGGAVTIPITGFAATAEAPSIVLAPGGAVELLLQPFTATGDAPNLGATLDPVDLQLDPFTATALIGGPAPASTALVDLRAVDTDGTSVPNAGTAGSTHDGTLQAGAAAPSVDGTYWTFDGGDGINIAGLATVLDLSAAFTFAVACRRPTAASSDAEVFTNWEIPNRDNQGFFQLDAGVMEARVRAAGDTKTNESFGAQVMDAYDDTDMILVWRGDGAGNVEAIEILNHGGTATAQLRTHDWATYDTTGDVGDWVLGGPDEAGPGWEGRIYGIKVWLSAVADAELDALTIGDFTGAGAAALILTHGAAQQTLTLQPVALDAVAAALGLTGTGSVGLQLDPIEATAEAPEVTATPEPVDLVLQPATAAVSLPDGQPDSSLIATAAGTVNLPLIPVEVIGSVADLGSTVDPVALELGTVGVAAAMSPVTAEATSTSLLLHPATVHGETGSVLFNTGAAAQTMQLVAFDVHAALGQVTAAPAGSAVLQLGPVGLEVVAAPVVVAPGGPALLVLDAATLLAAAGPLQAAGTGTVDLALGPIDARTIPGAIDFAGSGVVELPLTALTAYAQANGLSIADVVHQITSGPHRIVPAVDRLRIVPAVDRYRIVPRRQP
ncbi:MAG: hypothetical protein AAGA99_26355 [Actinomycetota bacterium]